MAESTLSLTYTDIATEVSDHLGYGRRSSTSEGWSDDEKSRVERSLDKGYRDFLNSNKWSFLRKFSTITTAEDDNDYDLADDFGSLDSSITYGTDQSYAPIILTSEPEIRKKQTGYNGTSRPTYCCLRPKANDGTSGQRYEVILFPDPDGAYTLYYAYNVLASTRLRASTPYPLGGMYFGEALQMCCVAAADRLFNDMGEAEYQQTIKLCVMDAVRRDNEMRPKNLGYNGDGESGSSSYRPVRTNTYNGSVGT